MIIVKYSGKYPNLCSGQLIVDIDGATWTFPDYCLSSGGSITFDGDWNENVTNGRWSICKWLENFPEELKEAVLAEVNASVRHGCCGGCG
jgi:hypothetical protein